VSLHATCCTGTAPAGADASVGDSKFTTGTGTSTCHGDLQPLSLALCQKAFSSRETTLLYAGKFQLAFAFLVG